MLLRCEWRGAYECIAHSYVEAGASVASTVSFLGHTRELSAEHLYWGAWMGGRGDVHCSWVDVGF